MTKIQEEAKTVLLDVMSQAKLKKGDCLIIGCSSSEVNGDVMGTNSSVDTAAQLFDVLYEETKKAGIYLATQCCEHLNRAVVVEAEYAAMQRLDEVNVCPRPKAGGAFATAAYQQFQSPVVVETIQANAGIDIGGVLIGMHIKSVAVPIKLHQRCIGKAIVIAARSRPKFIGGARANYVEEKM